MTKTTASSSSKDEEEDEEKIKSKLDKSIRELIELICDMKQMNQSLMEMQIDIKKMPLGI